MAKDKKSFVLYADFLNTVSKLNDNKAGKLFKTILEYVNDMNPEVNDLLIQVAFEPIKLQLKRDLKKYENTKQKRSEAGKLGGRPRKAKKANAFSEKQTKAKKADTVTVTDTVIWNNIKNNFFNAFEWQEKFCKDKKIGPKLLIDRMHEFISDIELREDYKDLKELKSHFTNLFNLNTKNGKQQKGGGEPSYNHLYPTLNK